MGRGESMPDRGGLLDSPPEPALPRASSCPLPWLPCREGEGRPDGSLVPHLALLANAACQQDPSLSSAHILLCNDGDVHLGVIGSLQCD